MSGLEGLNVIGYCRVSTDDKGQTNENQEREIKKWAKDENVNLIAIYKDEKTGTTLNRPGFLAMIGHINLENIPVLVAYDQSRLTRNEELSRIKALIPNCQIRYVSSNLDPASLSGRLNDAIKQVFDKEENLIRSQKTKIGMETKRLQGKHLGRPVKVAFSDETLPEGCINEKTRIVSKYEILEFANQGKRFSVMCRLLGLEHQSLRRAMERTGIYRDYMNRLERFKH